MAAGKVASRTVALRDARVAPFKSSRLALHVKGIAKVVEWKSVSRWCWKKWAFIRKLGVVGPLTFLVGLATVDVTPEELLLLWHVGGKLTKGVQVKGYAQ